MSTNTVYQFEKNFTDAIVGMFRSSVSISGVPTANIIAERSTAVKTTPRIEVSVKSAFPASGHMRVNASGSYYYDDYQAEIEIAVATNRLNLEPHDEMCGSVRYLLSRQAQSLVSPVITLYEVCDIQESGGSSGIDLETLEDVTTFRHVLRFSIRP